MYTLFLMIDANFRARLKDRGFDDFELAPGWSYYVEESAYLKHVAKFAAQKEVSSTSDDAAVTVRVMLTIL